MKTIIHTILFIFLSGIVFSQDAKQTIKGIVLDKDSELPLIGATIELVSNETVEGVTSDLDGEFKMPNVSIGRHILKISYLGYESSTIPNIVVSSGKEVILNIELEESFQKLDEVVITAQTEKDKTVNEMATVSARTFSMEEVVRYSGGRNDVSRLVSNYAGVSTADDSRNDIVIRGNSPTSVQWKLEGVAIPNPNHFATLGTTGGPVSALNTNLLKNSDFLTSAFPAEYGNALSGVFDIGFRSGNKENYEATVQLAAFSGLEAMVEGPLNGSKSSSFVLSFRNSFVGLADAAGIPIGTNATPDYRDLSFKLDFARSKLGKFEAFGIFGTSDITFLAAETDENDLFAEPDADAVAESRLGIVGLKHTYLIDESTYLRTTLSATHAKNDFTLERYTDDTFTNKIKYASADDIVNRQVLSTYINSKRSSKLTFRGGINIERMDISSISEDSSGNPDLNEDGIEDLIIGRNVNDDLYLYELYLHEKYKLNSKSILQIGLHTQFLSLNRKGVIEPRLGYTYKHSDTQTFSIGIGIHSQISPLPFMLQTVETNVGPEFINKDLDFTKSRHFVLGWDLKIGSSWRTKVEIYYQSLYNVPVEEETSSFSSLNFGADFGFPTTTRLVNEGTGQNYGIELTIEKFFSKQYYGLLTASLFDSKYKGSDDIERNTAFSNNYVVNLLGGKEYNLGKRHKLTTDFKFTLAGGRRFTPIDLAASQIIDSEVLIEDEAFSQRYPHYMRIDFKIGVALNSGSKKFSQQFFLDFQNITNRENVFVNRYNRVKNEVNTVLQSGFFPDLLYRVQF